jgi:hypothetical protein
MHRDGAYLGTWENYKNTPRYSILELAVILIRWPKKILQVALLLSNLVFAPR